MGSTKNLMLLSVTDDVVLGEGMVEKMTFSPALVTSLSDEGFDTETQEASAQLICSMVTKWEITGPVPVADVGSIKEGSIIADGEPVPLDPEIVSKLPFPLQQAIIRGVIQASVPKSLNTTKPGTK